MLIVRDSATMLTRCLTSLSGVVDTIHVHDTGSEDGTPALAGELGAVVSHGTWTGDFAAARNAALAAAAAARGTPWTPADWVLSIDADDRAVAAPGKLREVLAATTADALLVDIDNAHDELPYTFRTARLFRPAHLRWQGRVHEHLVRIAGGGAPDVFADRGHGTGVGTGYGTGHGAGTVQGIGIVEWPSAPREAILLEHQGYADPQERRSKAERNVELAQAVLDGIADGSTDSSLVADTLLDLGRSLVGAGRTQDAVDAFETLRELAPGTRQWILGTDALARLLLGAGMDEAVLVLTAQLRGAGVARDYCDWLDAQALAQLGDVAEAWRLLQPVQRVVDPAGRVYPPEHLAELKRLVDRLHTMSTAAGGT
ncbi:glycosyltransferase family 2 protein [Dactylosporangium aurantiacum]|uniref:Glycosyltransferase family 2 protein n=1 Tax=Dactylosporangium aurantiacum TaxID=35754 RepID=A0A9Q9MI23_9ACTN|nr:glycosyltransferase family 2 protein [Dactylosporangium aurantiacum]MDG6107809.1 glycosyltransferase family 2 protein [Dactylosporangium aurantiacum]UWZ57414.1 glycosyltransferase family 2 protein [Dactylosporangium aurantiacum]